MRYEFERRERRSPDGPKPRLPAQSKALSQVFDDYLNRRDLNPGLARDNGWYPSDQAGDQAPRIVIPCSSPYGVAYWQARAMDGSEPKYQSPSTSRFDSVVIVWPSVDQGGRFVLVEGPMDALAAAGSGLPGVAMMGNQPPQGAWRFIQNRFSGTRPLVLPDADSMDSAIRWTLQLGSLGFRPSVGSPYPHNDLASVPSKERERYLR
jgi:hypothetical protein